MSYVDGFVAAVPDENREAFREMAERAAAVFKEHGALAVVECWGDDVPDGEVTSFPMAVHREEGETVVLAWIVWPSREARDAGNAKATADARMIRGEAPMPFDGPPHDLRRLRGAGRGLSWAGGAKGAFPPRWPLAALDTADGGWLAALGAVDGGLLPPDGRGGVARHPSA